MTTRRGFAMLTTLWVMSVAAIIAMAAAVIGRNAVSAGSHRVEMERARWIAAGCARRAEATIDQMLRDAVSAAEAAVVWRTLDRAIASSATIGPECHVVLDAAGTRLDVNWASAEMLTTLFALTGGSDEASSMSDAVVTWRDTTPSVAAAARAWYADQHRFAPRSGPIADVAELRRIRGLELGGEWEQYLSVDPGRVSLATAPVAVLQSVPGITREAAERIVELHDAGTPIADLLEVTGSISEASTQALVARYPDAVRATTPDPDAWIIRSRVTRGSPAIDVLVEWRVIRTGRRCQVAYTRSYI